MAITTWMDDPDVRRRAWRAVISVSTAVLNRMDEELREHHDMTLAEYDALLHVAASGDGGVRMSDLADNVLLTKAGLTALVDRLVRRDLVERVGDPDDRRVVRVTLTRQGEKTFREAARDHEQQIKQLFTAHLDPSEAAVIADVLARTHEKLEA